MGEQSLATVRQEYLLDAKLLQQLIRFNATDGTYVNPGTLHIHIMLAATFANRQPLISFV